MSIASIINKATHHQISAGARPFMNMPEQLVAMSVPMAGIGGVSGVAAGIAGRGDEFRDGKTLGASIGFGAKLGAGLGVAYAGLVHLSDNIITTKFPFLPILGAALLVNGTAGAAAGAAFHGASLTVPRPS